MGQAEGNLGMLLMSGEHGLVFDRLNGLESVDLPPLRAVRCCC